MLVRHIVRFVAIVFIVIAASMAWFALAGVMNARTDEAAGKLDGAVAGLWGEKQAQREPEVHLSWERNEPAAAAGWEVHTSGEEELTLTSSRIEVTLDLDQRRKGLLWYSTYRAGVTAEYTFRSDAPADGVARVVFPLPTDQGVYDNFQVYVDGAEVKALDRVRFRDRSAIELKLPCAQGREVRYRVQYVTQGLDEWRYVFAHEPAQVRDFSLTVHTNFAAVDFPADTMSPTLKKPSAQGWDLTWAYQNLVGGRQLAVTMPHRLNPGPLAARMAMFAPVSLIFFLGVLFFLYLLRGLPLHPVHYAFVSASFFAFHLLLAHLVDHLDLFLSFAIASLVSVALVVSYLRLVVNPRFAYLEAGVAQLLYLVLFSLAHFFEGWTGLTVTVGAIVTLFVLMQLTARLDWEKLLSLSVAGRASAKTQVDGLC